MFLFLDFTEAIGSRGNFLGFVGNVGSIFNFSKKKLFGNKITVKLYSNFVLEKKFLFTLRRCYGLEIMFIQFDLRIRTVGNIYIYIYFYRW